MAIDLLKATAPPLAAKPAAKALNATDFRFLQDYVYRESGIVLDADKQYLLDSRLMPIVRKEGMQGLEDLCNLLRGTQGQRLRQPVVEAMTTNETLFFRETSQYDALRRTVLPQLVAERDKTTRRLSFWSAAASTGQEAYSLAMMLVEMGLDKWNLQIQGTDLNETVLERARQGRYMQIEVNRGLPIQLLMKYFHRVGLDWQLKDEIRRMVHWQRFDLRQQMKGRGPYDFIFCRNVLIYFDGQTKKQILSEFRNAIHKGGYLLLGGAETAINMDTGFRRVEIGQAAMYQAV
ncbi:MAG: protein-glutamate O-methyltransferase CheR [Bryobacteraceae bacterium]